MSGRNCRFEMNAVDSMLNTVLIAVRSDCQQQLCENYLPSTTEHCYAIGWPFQLHADIPFEIRVGQKSTTKNKSWSQTALSTIAEQPYMTPPPPWLTCCCSRRLICCCCHLTACQAVVAAAVLWTSSAAAAIAASRCQ